jgi:hypothetical protein
VRLRGKIVGAITTGVVFSFILLYGHLHDYDVVYWMSAGATCTMMALVLMYINLKQIVWNPDHSYMEQEELELLPFWKKLVEIRDM